jgi:carboxy-terminal domain RNA polymerase II polypeptide A small phosphatase
MTEKHNKLLVLDLDETLIHATENPLSITEDFRFEQYFIYLRPQLNTFLTNVAQHFTLGVWSSASDEYVTAIANLLKPAAINFEFIWGRSRCTLKRDYTFDQYYFEKKLDKLKKKGFPLEQIIIVDDSPEKSRTNYGNAVYIKEFCGDPADNELQYLYDYLLTLKLAENIRTIEKRGWRMQNHKPL